MKDVPIGVFAGLAGEFYASTRNLVFSGHGGDTHAVGVLHTFHFLAVGLRVALQKVRWDNLRGLR